MFKLWQALSDLRSSLWLIPSATVLVAIALAASAIELDANLELHLSDLSARLFGASPEGARGLLQVIAGAMISTATLTFSITMLVLSNVATQYTPAVIRTVMSSRPTQFTLGIFIGIFVYCLLVLRTVRAGDVEFVPSISIFTGLLLSIVGVGVLVYFVHHVASSIQAPMIVSRIARDTLESMRQRLPLLPRSDSADSCACAPSAAQTEPPPLPSEGSRPLPASQSGYLRDLDLPGMQAWCEKHRTRVVMDAMLGEFICCAAPVAWTDQAVSGEAMAAFQRLYSLADIRSVQQDPTVGLEQLVEITLKAQSPSTDDRGTVVLCIDRLGELLVEWSRRACDKFDEHPLVQIRPRDFSSLLRFVVSPLVEGADGRLAHYVLLLSMLGKVASQAEPSRRAVVIGQFQRVAAVARVRLTHPPQAEELQQTLGELIPRLGSAWQAPAPAVPPAAGR